VAPKIWTSQRPCQFYGGGGSSVDQGYFNPTTQFVSCNQVCLSASVYEQGMLDDFVAESIG